MKEADKSHALRDRLILVIEDDEDVRLSLLTVFADAGARILEAETGQAGLEMAQKTKPDLITLDLVLPDDDEFSVFCSLRETVETSQIPICILTGHPEYRKYIYDLPVRRPEGFISKPIDFDDLIDTARRIIALEDRRRDRQRKRQAEAADSP